MNPRRTLSALLAAAALLFAACGDDDDSADSGSTPAADAGEAGGSATESDTIDIVDFVYDPTPISAAAGSEITVSNADGTPHTVTARNGEFNSDSIDGGAEGTLTVPDAPGSYDFYCSFHPFMEGTLVVG